MLTYVNLYDFTKSCVILCYFTRILYYFVNARVFLESLYVVLRFFVCCLSIYLSEFTNLLHTRSLAWVKHSSPVRHVIWSSIFDHTLQASLESLHWIWCHNWGWELIVNTCQSKQWAKKHSRRTRKSLGLELTIVRGISIRDETVDCLLGLRKNIGQRLGAHQEKSGY